MDKHTDSGRHLVYVAVSVGAEVNYIGVSVTLNVTFGLGRHSQRRRQRSMFFYFISCDSFCRTSLQDHLHGLLSTCEGCRVDGEMPELVLAAKLGSML